MEACYNLACQQPDTAESQPIENFKVINTGLANVRLIVGNIFTMHVAAIVIPNNNFFQLADVGSQGALIELLGGRRVAEETLNNRIGQDHPLGTTVVCNVPKSNMKCSFVCHVVTGKFVENRGGTVIGALPISEQDVRTTIKTALDEINGHRLSTVAIPSFFSQHHVSHWDKSREQRMKDIVLEECLLWAVYNRGSTLQEIRVVVYDGSSQ